jgi:hypothetical protein
MPIVNSLGDSELSVKFTGLLKHVNVVKVDEKSFFLYAHVIGYIDVKKGAFNSAEK